MKPYSYTVSEQTDDDTIVTRTIDKIPIQTINNIVSPQRQQPIINNMYKSTPIPNIMPKQIEQVPVIKRKPAGPPVIISSSTTKPFSFNSRYSNNTYVSPPRQVRSPPISSNQPITFNRTPSIQSPRSSVMSSSFPQNNNLKNLGRKDPNTVTNTSINYITRETITTQKSKNYFNISLIPPPALLQYQPY